ncbi:hypothetical protein [Streptomyces sp. GC420]|uniref:COG1470 family protein n=1 Tax=Streptomyces sp. GC420 TaxID=2697568 RepID=UPI0014152D25|nr:hypothetical protein [Streptomyces sp. GC420]NBM20630.1 hypothetical protein [Streptomyces sp. GC420]
MPPRLARAALTAAVVLLAVPAVPAVPTVPTVSAVPARAASGEWSARPASAGGGHGRPAFYLRGVPGSVLQDTVSLTNPGARAVTVRLGGTGTRFAFAQEDVRVPARTRAEVPFTVTVPGDAVPGERSGRLLASAGGTRRSVPVRLSVSGPALSALTVERVRVEGSGEDTVIRYELVNRGNTALAPRLAVRAEGVFGTLLDRRARSEPARLPPGGRLRLAEPWPGAPAFDAVSVRLTATAAGAATARGRASARFVPWGAVPGAVLALCAATAVTVHLVRRGRTER